MQPNDITFFQRFQNDILTGRKTITIRDASESHFKAGDVLRVGNRSDRDVNRDAGHAERKTCAAGKYVA